MGIVYLAKNKLDGSKLALKAMITEANLSDRARENFKREIDVTKTLHHPNIVSLFDHGSTGSGFFFAMEFCPGGSVYDSMLKLNSTLSIKASVQIALDALSGLAYAHQKGFVHRDIKPQNILLSSPSNGVAKLADFGLAKSFQESGLSGMTVTGDRGGTLAFMPREQLINFKYVKPVSDIWSLGATFYFMLTGATPRDNSSKATELEILFKDNIIPIRDRNYSIPEKLAQIIDCSLSSKPQNRFNSAVEFRSELESVL